MHHNVWSQNSTPYHMSVAKTSLEIVPKPKYRDNFREKIKNGQHKSWSGMNCLFQILWWQIVPPTFCMTNEKRDDVNLYKYLCKLNQSHYRHVLLVFVRPINLQTGGRFCIPCTPKWLKDIKYYLHLGIFPASSIHWCRCSQENSIIALGSRTFAGTFT